MVSIQLLLAAAGVASAAPAAAPAAASAPPWVQPSQVAMAADGKRLLFTLTPRETGASTARIWYWEPGGRKIGQRLGTLLGTRDAVDRTPARPLTQSTGRSHSPAFTPDGQQVSFGSARDATGRTRVWVLPLDGGEAEAWTDPDRDVREYAWMPDGALLYVAAGAAAGDELWFVPAEAGPEQRLHQAPGLGNLVPDFAGTAVAFTTDDGNSQSLWSVTPADGTVREIASEPGLRSPAWIRDDGRLAWLVSRESADEIRAVTVNRDALSTVFTASPEAPRLRGLRSGAETPWLFVVAQGPGTSRLIRVRPGNGRAEPVTPADGRVGDFALRANGEKAAFVWESSAQPPEVATWSFPDTYVEVRTQRNPVFPESAPREGENE